MIDEIFKESASCLEYLFRFNRRSSKARGMLFWRLMQLAVACDPTTRAAIIQPHI